MRIAFVIAGLMALLAGEIAVLELAFRPSSFEPHSKANDNGSVRLPPVTPSVAVPVAAHIQATKPTIESRSDERKPAEQPMSSAFALSGLNPTFGIGQAGTLAAQPQDRSTAPNQDSATPPVVESRFDITPGLEERGISVRGADGPNSVLDGPMTEDPALVPEEVAGAARLPTKKAARLPNGKPAILDVSEGTPLDPLADHSWDLNSAKTVPAAESPPAPAAGKKPARAGRRPPNKRGSQDSAAD